jgi:peptidyl-tRNA hydrolase
VSREREEREPSLYLIIREDVALSRTGLATVAAQITWRVLRAARMNAPDRFDAYEQAPTQSKIALRAEGTTTIDHAIAAAEAIQLPNALIVNAGAAVAAGIGPAAGSEVPAAIQRLQMLSDTAHPGPCIITAPVERLSDAGLWLLVRNDIEIPRGKLATLAAHSCWAALKGDLSRTVPWEAAGSPVRVRGADATTLLSAHLAAQREGLPVSLIADVRRIVFGEPAVMVLAIGPATLDDVPAILLTLQRLND